MLYSSASSTISFLHPSSGRVVIVNNKISYFFHNIHEIQSVEVVFLHMNSKPLVLIVAYRLPITTPHSYTDLKVINSTRTNNYHW